MQGKSKNTVIVTHKFVTHPDDALVEYLNKKKCQNVLHICHSFYEAPNRSSYYTWYKNGKIFNKKETIDYSFLPESLIYLKETFFTLIWILFSRRRWDIFIGMDGLCVLMGNVLKKLLFIRKSIYWAIDFVPKNRFKEPWKNKIYHQVNIHGYKHSDEMWDLSPRMAEAREKYLGVSEKDYKKIRTVPYGVYTEQIEKYSYSDCDQHTIVFMGRINESQGAQSIIKVLPKLALKYEKLKFKIIGTGPYLNELKKLASKLGVSRLCHFLGKIDDHKEVEIEIARSCVAVAPYIKKLDKWTYYADPGKVKTYLACGVPVILTDLPWNAKEIEENQCGLVISENDEEIFKAIIKLMNPETNQNYRRNAIRYSERFNYKNIFEEVSL